MINLGDLVTSFPTSIYLQHFASIQPRTIRLIFIILAASRDLIFTERSSPCRRLKKTEVHERRFERGRPMMTSSFLHKSRRAAAGRAQLLANSGRRGMGRLPRKCELRGPLPGPRTFRRGLIGKIRQNLFSFFIFIFCTYDFRTKFRNMLSQESQKMCFECSVAKTFKVYKFK